MATIFKKILELSKEGISLQINPIRLTSERMFYAKENERKRDIPDRYADIEFVFTNMNPGLKHSTSFRITHEMFESAHEEIMDTHLCEMIDLAIKEVLI